MALNFAGLGFIFGAKDQGATRVAGRTAKSMEFLHNVFQRLDVTARASKFNAVINSWSAAKIDELTDKIGNLNSEMGSMSMTTGIEQELFDIKKLLKPIGAQAGYTAKQFNAAAKAAQGMVSRLNFSPDEAVEAVKTLGKPGRELVKAFSDSKRPLEDAALALKVLGINGDQAKGMVRGFVDIQGRAGVSAEDARKKFRGLINHYAAMGKGAKNASLLMKTFPKVIDVVNESSERLSREFNLNSKEIDTLVKGTANLAIRLRKFYPSSEDAAQGAADFTKKFIDMKEQVQGFLRGEGNLDILKQILPNIHDVEGGMKALATSPKNFIELVHKAYESGTAGGIKFFTDMKGAFDGKIAALMTQPAEQWEKDSIKIQKASEYAAKNSAGAMARLARDSHSAARTFEEVMSRMEDSYTMQMRQLSGLKKSDILDIHRRKYNRILDITSTLTAGDGPISKLTGFFIRWKQAGAHAALGAIGGELLEIGEAAIPAATMMGSLGFRFSDVGRYAKVPLAPLAILNKMFLGMPGIITKFGGIIGAVTIGISLLGKKLQGTAKIGKSWHENMADEIFNISKKFLSFVPWIEGNLKDMKPWERVGFILKTGMDLAWDWVVENFKFGKKTIANIINKLADGINSIDWGKWSRKITEFITGSIVNVMDGIGDFFKALFSGEIIKGIEKSKSPIGEAISNFFIAVGRAIRDSVRGIWDSFVDWWEDDTKSAGDKIKEGGKFIGGLALAGMIAVPGFRQAGFGLMGKFLGGVEAAGGGLFSVFNKMFLGLPGILLKVLGPPALIIGGIGILGHAFEKMGIKSFEGFTDSFGYMFKTKLPNLIYDTAIKYLPKSISDSMISVANKAKSEGSGIWGQLGAVLVAGAKYAFEKFLDISEIITNKLANIDFNEVSNKIGNFFTSVITGLSSFISGAVSGLFTDGFDKSTELTLGQRFGVAIKNGFFVALDFVKAAIVGIADSIASTFSRIWSDKSTGLGEKLVSSLFTGAAVIGGIGLLLKIFKKKFVSGAKEMAICPKFECNDKRGLFRRTFGKKHDERVPFCPKFECGDSRGWFRRTFGKKHDERIEFCPKLECSKDVKKGFFSRRKKQMQGVGFCPVNEKCISSTIERGVSRAGKKIKKRGLFGRIRDRFRKTPEYGMKELGRGSLWQRAKGKFRGEIELEGDSFKKPESRFKRMMKRLRGEPKLKLIDINKVTKKLNKTEGLFSRFKKRVGSKFKRGPKLVSIGEFTGDINKVESRFGGFFNKTGRKSDVLKNKLSGIRNKLTGMGSGLLNLGGIISGSLATAFITLAHSIPKEKVIEFRDNMNETEGILGFIGEASANLVIKFQELSPEMQNIISIGGIFAATTAPAMIGAVSRLIIKFGLLKAATLVAYGGLAYYAYKGTKLFMELMEVEEAHGKRRMSAAKREQERGKKNAFVDQTIKDIKAMKKAGASIHDIKDRISELYKAGLIKDGGIIDYAKTAIKDTGLLRKAIVPILGLTNLRDKRVNDFFSMAKDNKEVERSSVAYKNYYSTLSNGEKEIINIRKSSMKMKSIIGDNKTIDNIVKTGSAGINNIKKSGNKTKEYIEGNFKKISGTYKKEGEKTSKSIAKINKKTTDDVSGNVLFKKISSIMSSYEAGEMTAATAFKVLGRHSNIIKQIKDIYGKDGAKLMLKVKKFTESYISESAKIGSTKGGKKLEERYLKLKEQYESIKGFTKKDIDKRKKIYSSIMKLENIMEKKSLKNKKGAANNVLRFEKELGIKRAKARNTGGGGMGTGFKGDDKGDKDTARTLDDITKEKKGILGVVEARKKELDYFAKKEKKWGGLFGIEKDLAEKRRREIPKELAAQKEKLGILDTEMMSMTKLKVMEGTLSKTKDKKKKKILSSAIKEEKEYLGVIRSGKVNASGLKEINAFREMDLKGNKQEPDKIKDLVADPIEFKKASVGAAKILEGMELGKNKQGFGEIKSSTSKDSAIEALSDIEFKKASAGAARILEDIELGEIGQKLDKIKQTATFANVDDSGSIKPNLKKVFTREPKVTQESIKDGPPDMSEQISFLSSQIKTLGDRVGSLKNQQFVIVGEMGKFMRVIKKEEIFAAQKNPAWRK